MALMFLSERATEKDAKFNRSIMIMITLIKTQNVSTKYLEAFESKELSVPVCYLGYGSAAKLLSSAIKKVVSVSSESECKNECIKYRDTSNFKCLSFSFG